MSVPVEHSEPANREMFLYCYTAQYHNTFRPRLIPANASWRQKTNPIMYSSEKPGAKQAAGEFMMPMAFRQKEKFELLNMLRVNVFLHSNKKLNPFLISNNKNNSFNLDLLLLRDGSMHHYVLITDIKALIHKYLEKHQRIDNHMCRNCFHISTSLDLHKRHEEKCHQNTQAIIKMPKSQTA